jgi:hypothetical protein
MGLFAASASASASGVGRAPRWTVSTLPAPAAFHAGDSSDFFQITAVNDGAAATTGTMVIRDELPAGITVNGFSGLMPKTGFPGEEDDASFLEPGCSQQTVAGRVQVVCAIAPTVGSGRSVVINVTVQVPAEAVGPIVNRVTVSGGGAAPVASVVSVPVTPATEQIPFGAMLSADISGASGPFTQAGGHPYDFITVIGFHAAGVDGEEHCLKITSLSCPVDGAQVRDLETAVPPGLVGNATAMPHCNQDQFEKGITGCPAPSQVGRVELYFYGSGTAKQTAPVYNIEPSADEPAELGFTIAGAAHIPIRFHVRTDGDYGLTADVAGVSQFDSVWLTVLSIWGEPSDPAHDVMRRSNVTLNCASAGCPSGVYPPTPFLRMPTSCPGAPLSMSIRGDSWQAPTSPLPTLAETTLAGTNGCGGVPFAPSMILTTTSHQAGAPAGYSLVFRLPQSEEPEGVGSADIRDTEVTLPEGTVLSPSAANGLVACSEAEFELHAAAKGRCPAASRVGTVSATTPLLKVPLTGSVYVGRPECSPCTPADAASGRMTRLLVEVDGAGVVIKQAGRTRIDQASGQLVTAFENMPQDPVGELSVSLESGATAPLVNPATCGPLLASAALTPWSSAAASAISAPALAIEGCNAPGFTPAFTAARTTSARAGQFTGFAVSLSRDDGEQNLGRVSVTTPPGLLGVLKSAEQCAEAQANQGTCSAASQIGTGSVVVGPGSVPLTIGGAKVYLTGPYEGKPFGLSIVTPAQAGPFTLAGNAGNGTEVVRAAIAIDPHTSALTVASDPLPLELNGVPLDIRKVDIDINREGLMFSPTNCDAMSVTGSIASTTGSSESVSYPFQTTACGIVPFKPTFTVSTQGKASKASGASLHVKVTSAGGPQAGGGEANIAKVKVNLPLQLPSRLSTLQKACVDSVFEANPGSCPAASVVGQATAVTPVLAHPLTGPAYLVSHAGAAFPDLEIVLQGEGITLMLDGNTQIKKGITSSIFRAVPDAPISSFDLVLPEGPHSVLATNLPAKAKQNLCGQTLNMPTVITGQNGAVVRQTTKIAITGCPRHKTKGKSKKH